MRRQQKREYRQKDRQCLLRERARGQKREGRQQDRQCRQQRKAFSKEVAIVKGRQLKRKQQLCEEVLLVLVLVACFREQKRNQIYRHF